VNIDGMLRALECVQDSVTHTNELGPEYVAATREKIAVREALHREIVEYVKSLKEATDDEG
jgi:hypothetical protein